MAGLQNLIELYAQADPYDISDGLKAYRRYRMVMNQIASYYQRPLSAVVGAFVALSPNSDYHGNLRSLVSMLDAGRQGLPYERAIVSTYNACRDRAALYLTGTKFLDHAKGPKTRAFYENILFPRRRGPVTVDGHMYHAWAGTAGGMRDAKVTKRIYGEISADISKLADRLGQLPHETQAILWFTRKRIQDIIYDPQHDLFDRSVGNQKTIFRVEEIRGYGTTEDPDAVSKAMGILGTDPTDRQINFGFLD